MTALFWGLCWPALGATGIIYAGTHSTLRHLGIDGKTASQRCCADLHISTCCQLCHEAAQD